MTIYSSVSRQFLKIYLSFLNMWIIKIITVLDLLAKSNGINVIKSWGCHKRVKDQEKDQDHFDHGKINDFILFSQRLLSNSLGKKCLNSPKSFHVIHSSPLYWFPRAAIVKYYKWGVLNHRHLFSHISGAGSPRSKCWQSWSPLRPLS